MRDPPGAYIATGVASADLNGDGKPDLITTEVVFTNTISVLLGNGDGTFQPRVTYAAGSAPEAVEVGDFNGDSKVDLVAAERGGNTVGGFLGNGDGTLQARIPYAAGNGPYSVVVADFDNDGALDLATADLGDSTVSIFLGNATTTSSTTTVSTVISPISDLSVATQAAALTAQATIDGHLQTVSAVSGIIGAAQSRFEVAASALRTSAVNFRDAESRVVDADAAEESAKLIRTRILQQAGSVVLRRANQAPALALELLSAVSR